MICCCFTGHRPKNLPWQYDETDPDCILLKEVLASQTAALVDRGVTGFISGMALGVDLWAAQTVLELRKDNPAIKLCCALPCEGQEKKWPAKTQEHYQNILRQADKTVYVSRLYTSSCMLDRNRWMVDHASILLAVYNGAYRTGTAMTVRYAKEKRRKIILIDPVTREVTYPNGGL